MLSQTVAIKSKSTYSPPDTPSQTITYFTLAQSLAPGSLSIAAGNTTFSYTLPAVKYGTITIGNLKNISQSIYGVNFPQDANYIKTLGIKMSRWGEHSSVWIIYNSKSDLSFRW
jgi:hypothetical protein